MNVDVYDLNGSKVAEMRSQGIVIRSARDAAEVVRELQQRGIRKLILYEGNLCPEAWRISNGLAAAILKEFRDQAVDVAFVGELSLHKEKSIQEFIKAQDAGHFSFVRSMDLAKNQLSL